jgi:hypothetical protein
MYKRRRGMRATSHKYDRAPQYDKRKCETILKTIFLMSILLLLSIQFPLPVHAAGEAVILNNHSGYLSRTSGRYNVIGEVQNTGDGALSTVKITATFYNSAGAVLTTDITYANIWVLHPGQKSPFWNTLLDEAISAKVDHYTLEISYRQSHTLPVGLEILSHAAQSSKSGAIHVVGEIKNIGVYDAHAVKLVATFYSLEDERVVGVGITFSKPNDLTPGQKGSFDVLLVEGPLIEALGITMYTYSLQAQSEEYHFIPEFPVPTPILLMVILLAVAVTRVRVVQKEGAKT